jgi:thymidylate kinase
MQGKIVIANRFTGSNMAHQGTKFRNTGRTEEAILSGSITLNL